MDDAQRAEFSRELEMNLTLTFRGAARFRVNILRQRTEVSIVARCIGSEIPQRHELSLPEVLTDLIMQKRGLMLFVGDTSSRKFTSRAAMTD